MLRRRMTAFLCILVILVSSISPYLTSLAVYAAEYENTEYEWTDEAEAPSVFAAQEEEAAEIPDTEDMETFEPEEVEVIEEAPEIGETEQLAESADRVITTVLPEADVAISLSGRMPKTATVEASEEDVQMTNVVRRPWKTVRKRVTSNVQCSIFKVQWKKEDI